MIMVITTNILGQLAVDFFISLHCWLLAFYQQMTERLNSESESYEQTTVVFTQQQATNDGNIGMTVKGTERRVGEGNTRQQCPTDHNNMEQIMGARSVQQFALTWKKSFDIGWQRQVPLTSPLTYTYTSSSMSSSLSSSTAVRGDRHMVVGCCDSVCVCVCGGGRTYTSTHATQG